LLSGVTGLRDDVTLGPTDGIVVLDPRNGTLRRLVELAPGVTGRPTVAWSPTGGALAFSVGGGFRPWPRVFDALCHQGRATRRDRHDPLRARVQLGAGRGFDRGQLGHHSLGRNDDVAGRDMPRWLHDRRG
jgi:hypothetical protein